jgi:CHAT domain-containing protein
VLVLAISLVVSGLPQSAPFDRCSAALRADSLSRAAAECFQKAATTPERLRGAARRLELEQLRHPTSPWIAFYLAEVQALLRAPDTSTYYRFALAKFIARADAAGEVEARIALGTALLTSGRRDQAWREASAARDAARRSGNTHLTAQAMIYEAWVAQQTGEKLAHGIRVLHDAQALVLPDGPYALRVRILRLLGNLSVDLGHYDQALGYYATMIELARANRDLAMEVLGSWNALNTRRKQMEERPEAGRLPEFTDAARDLVRLSEATGDADLQAGASRALADLLQSARATHAAAGPHYRKAIALARPLPNRFELMMSLWALGRYLSDTRPLESRRLIEEALRLAVDSGHGSAVAYAWRQQARLAWKTMPREHAISESLRALDAIDTLGALQSTEMGQASVLGPWTLDYHWLIGRLLDPAASSRDDVALAFQVAERMRARVLLQSMTRPAGGEAPNARRQQLLRAISDVQRQLLDPRLDAASRRTVTAQLERLEREEEATRSSGARGRQGGGEPRLAPLERVEQALAANEAMLSFTVGVGQNFYGDFGGGAWLLVSTRTGTRVVQIPDRTQLHAMVSIFRGLAERDDVPDVQPTYKLHDTLVRAALDVLPAQVTRLIIVPDGSLHHVPFAALRNATSSFLGSRFEIVVAPSATIWMRLKEQPPSTTPAAALVLADPAVPPASRTDSVALERDWAPGVLQLESLPYSRTEGRAVVSHVGGASRLLAGAEATEAALKTASFANFAIVHFATHALVDEARPDRSAVFLAGDASAEDGLLQAREIVDLPLTGRIVVLSACRSATGALLAGEGVMGLSRSFFQAGARTVVGTLWSIRDDHAAFIADAFYAALARGRTIGGAMLDARTHAIENGIPASAWASFVVIGDDSVAIPIAGAQPTPVWLFAAGAAAAGGLIVVCVVWASRRRSAPAAPTTC